MLPSKPVPKRAKMLPVSQTRVAVTQSEPDHVKKLKLEKAALALAEQKERGRLKPQPQLGFHNAPPSPVQLTQERDINAMDRAIFDANQVGNFDQVMQLVNQGVSANMQREEADGSTALIAAVRWGNLQAAHFLLKHGANVRIKDYYHKSALIHAREIHDLVLRDQMLQLLDQFYLTDYADEQEEEEMLNLQAMFDFQSIAGIGQTSQACSTGVRLIRSGSSSGRAGDSSEEDEDSQNGLGDDEDDEAKEAGKCGGGRRKNCFFDDDDDEDEDEEDDYY
ncbi:hypothetical protein BASA81_003190 [Batrachochytrium salamandrivorans]|nr:hypothetical protein BASA81_003190 [Batrachochytrium salamandrivorans]